MWNSDNEVARELRGCGAAQLPHPRAAAIANVDGAVGGRPSVDVAAAPGRRTKVATGTPFAPTGARATVSKAGSTAARDRARLHLNSGVLAPACLYLLLPLLAPVVPGWPRLLWLLCVLLWVLPQP
ncbi:hypothetical protein Vretimale_5713, partial [Volvox reticuliferus]